MRKLRTLITFAISCIVVLLASATPAAAAGEPWKVMNAYYGICAHPEGDGLTNGTVLTVWKCGSGYTNTAYAQAFDMDSNGYIKHVRSNKCITPQGNSSADGTVLTLWTCNYSSSVQRFAEASNGLVWYAHNGGKCITPKGNSASNGVWLTLWSCTDSYLQKWNRQP